MVEIFDNDANAINTINAMQQTQKFSHCSLAACSLIETKAAKFKQNK